MDFNYWLRRTVSLEPFAFRHGLVLTLVIFGAQIHAAPLTFQFDATISQVRGDVGNFNLPFPLVVGQQFNGKYFFQSEQDLLDIFLHRGFGKQAAVALTINGTEISALANFGWVNSTGMVDVTGPKSSVSLGYFSLTNVFPGWGGYLKNHWWDAELTLLGPDGTIASTDDMLDIHTWNRLTTLRRLGLQFGQFQGSDFKVVTVEASVGDFSAVPEPSPILLVGIVVVLALLHIAAQRARAKIHF